MRRLKAAYVGGIAAVLFGATPVAAESFEPGCRLPFGTIADKDRDVDKSCGISGEASKEAHRAQNRAKNNFCATGKPQTLLYQHFKTLQREVDKRDIRYGSSNSLPEDRAELRGLLTVAKAEDGRPLRKVGEGSVVRYVGYVQHPRNSNLKRGESVNCKKGGAAWNDIHLDIVRRPGEAACLSITAEISPHFRPEAWEVPFLKELAAVRVPVRFTGHLSLRCEPQALQGRRRRTDLAEAHLGMGNPPCLRHRRVQERELEGLLGR